MVTWNEDFVDPDRVAALKRLMTDADIETILCIVGDLALWLDRVDVDDPTAIVDLKSIIDLAGAIQDFARAFGVKTSNQAGILKLKAERKAGRWITLHPNSLL